MKAKAREEEERQQREALQQARIQAYQARKDLAARMQDEAGS